MNFPFVVGLLVLLGTAPGCRERAAVASATRVTLTSDAAKNLKIVVPRIYTSIPNSTRSGIAVSAEDSPVVRPLVSDLLVLYGFDVGGHYELVAHRDLARLGVTKEQLHDRAIENLRASKFKVEAHRGERITMLTAGGEYEAALLLLPEVWQSVAGLVSGNIVASVPARDLLYITGDADPSSVTHLQQATARMLGKVDKPLSGSLVRWMDGRWHAYPPAPKWKTPNQSPEPTPGSVTPRATVPRSE